jgi:hypothetical protein
MSDPGGTWFTPEARRFRPEGGHQASRIEVAPVAGGPGGAPLLIRWGLTGDGATETAAHAEAFAVPVGNCVLVQS